jgi:hypothetical protein
MNLRATEGMTAKELEAVCCGRLIYCRDRAKSQLWPPALSSISPQEKTGTPKY